MSGQVERRRFEELHGQARAALAAARLAAWLVWVVRQEQELVGRKALWIIRQCGEPGHTTLS